MKKRKSKMTLELASLSERFLWWNHLGENFEVSIPLVPENVKNQHLQEILKNAHSLKDVPLEIRKAKASQPLYLIRYE